MATVPIYEPSIPVQDPGVPSSQIQPMTPAASSANVSEAAAGIGKEVENIGSRLEQHMVMMDRMQASQDAYDHLSDYRAALQQTRQQLTSKMGKDVGDIRSPDGIYNQYKKIINGVTAAPGVPGQAPLKAQFMQGLSIYQQKIFERGADNYNEAYGGQILNHQSTQIRAYLKQGHENIIDDAAQTAVDVKSPAGMMAIKDQIHSAFFDDKGNPTPYVQDQGWDADTAKRMELKAYDNAAQGPIKARADEDYKTAQTLLNSSGVQPEMRAHLQDNVINPAQVKQYADAGTKLILADTSLRNTNTLEIDQAAAEKSVRSMVAAEKLPAGHDQTVIKEIMSNVTDHNRMLNDQERNSEDEAKLAIYNMAKDPNATLPQAREQILNKAKFMRGQTYENVDNFATKAFAKDPDITDEAWKSAPKPVQDLLSTKQPEIQKKLTYPDEVKAFNALVKRRMMEGGARTQTQAEGVYQDMFKPLPTGSARYLGLFGRGTKPDYEIEEGLRSSDTAKGLSPDQLGKALKLMRDNGYPMSEKTLAAIKAKPELLK